MPFGFASSRVVRRGLFVLIAVLVVGTVGCDGGGSSSDGPPAAPSAPQATSQDGAVALTWDGSADATGYNVYRATSSRSGVSGAPVNGDAPVDDTSFSDTSVENGTRYYYRVTAVGSGGESPPSPEVSVRPFPRPPDRP
jgi:fibronectin type 3 domain-containing protein